MPRRTRQQVLPHIRGRQREPGVGTEVEGPRRGSWGHRDLNAVINLRNLIMPEGRCRDGRGRELHAKANPVS